jgi:3-oxoacyl-(acyl-carrier-protein) synthase
VITGLGVLGPWGAGADALARALAAGEAPLTELDDPGVLAAGGGDGPPRLTLDPRVRRAGRVDREHLTPWLPAREGRRMSRPSRFAVAAARMALESAGCTTPEDGADDLGVILSTTFGPTAVTEEMLEQIFLTGPESASPFLFAESVANAPAAQVARLLGARGANLTLTVREAGALAAVRRAAGEIAAGRSARMFAGVSDEVTPLLQIVLDGLGSLAHGTASEPPRARPFDRTRSGFVTAEGAAVLHLEDARAAAARDARPLARIAGGGEAFDPTAPRCGWGDGHGLLGRALAAVLDRAGLGFGDLDLVVSGATGSPDGDRMEALTLRAAAAGGGGPLPDVAAGLPPVVAPKAVVGELGGGHLAAAVLLLSGAGVDAVEAGAPGFREPDPELGITPWGYRAVGPGGPADSGVSGTGARPRRILVQTVAAGGPAAWLILERVPAFAAGPASEDRP